MIHSLFIANGSGEIFLERHWRGVISRNVCDYFFQALSKSSGPEDVPPVIVTPRAYLLTVYRNQVFFIAVVQSEVPPLFVFEFLHRIVDIFAEYFDGCTEGAIREHHVVCYQLLEEMMDNGFPLQTEANVLKELIRPPGLVRDVVNAVTGRGNVSSVVPTGQLSNVPWRRQGVRYAANEIYFDVIEEIDAIIDKNGTTVSVEVQGEIRSNCHLSGMPDLVLSFVNPRILDDVSFHPCVRFKRWEAERLLSFIPPDGTFKLVSYHVTTGSVVQIPIYVRPSISFTANGGHMDLQVGPKQTMGKSIEHVVISIPMPKSVVNVNFTATVGTYSFDPISKVVRWEIGKIPLQKLPKLAGSISLQANSPPPESPTITVDFKISQLATSGLQVNRLDLYGENYRPYKGVKYQTKAGKFQVRT
eukprot:Opistho-2@22279